VLLADGPRVAGSSSEAAAVQAFAADAATITGSLPSLESVPLPGGGMSRNVWASEVGRGDRVLLLGAHLDTVEGSPGADDNGSGLVVLLELLRRLVAEPPSGLRVAVVAFGAEEVLAGMAPDNHHFGSRLAAERLGNEGMLPDWMISVDMVGVGDRLMAVSYEDTDPSLAVEIAGAAEAVGVPVTTLSRGDISDHEAFARAGVPAAFVWRPDNPAWHTPDDTTVVDAALLENLAVLESLVARLTDQP
jgi:aminopeptidase YwaD